jgi:hypothetical protein
MLAQQVAIDPHARKVIDSSEMDELPFGCLRGGQDDIDSIPANASIIAEVIILGVPRQACLGRTPRCGTTDGGCGELGLGVGTELPVLIDHPSLRRGANGCQ